MKTFFTTSILLFFFVIAFNLFVDKNFFWHRQNAFAQQNLNDGDCINISEEKFTGNDRLSQRTIRKKMKRPDIVAFSSSRGAYADFSFFPGKKVYNTAVSISLLEDYIDVWMDLKKQNKIPSEAIIFLDGWIFNDGIVNFRSWDSVSGFLDFLKEQNISNELPPEQANRYHFEKKERLKKNLLNLISYPQTLTSLEVLLKNQYKNLDIKKCKSITDEQTYMTWMGAHWSLKITKPEDLARLINEKDSGLVYMDPWQKNDFMVKVLKTFIEDMKKNNVKVHIITPLVHPIALLEIKDTKPVKDFEAIVADLKNDSSIHVCDIYDSKKVPCENNEFKDAIHMTKTCLGKLMKFCGIINN